MNVKKIASVLLVLMLSVAFVFANGSKEASSSSSNTLKVAMECGYAPYNWTQTTDANGAVKISGSTEYAYGYDVMMAKLIAEKLGKDLEIVKLDWDSLVLKGAVCTSQQNTVWYDVCLPQIEDANILPAQESAPAMLVALSAGRVDLICTDMPTAQAALVAYPSFRLLDFTESDDNFVVSQEEINIGISVSKNNPELTAAINEVLATLTVEDYNRMMDEAISVQPLSN